MKTENNAALEELLEKHRQNFRVSARQKLEKIDDQLLMLSANEEDDPELVDEMLRDIHTLKGTGGTFGYSSITTVTHRLESFLASGQKISESTDNILTFVDCLIEIIASDPQPEGAELENILQKLPVVGESAQSQDSTRVREVLLVIPNQVICAMLQYHFEQNNCNVMCIASPFKAVEHAVQTQPDFVISSIILEGLDGTDLLRMLDAMTCTQSIKLAALTSLSLDDPVLKNLPETVSVIFNGDNMLDDILKILPQLDSAANT